MSKENLNFLNNIDWQNHDGVDFALINDFMRNQFYDRILSRYVQDQSCTDIGFGTGLLTMLALKHGAKHVRAFENNWDRYQLGCEIIQRLGLESRIELIHEKYNHDYAPTPITFTETVNGNLWQEGLWNSLPRDDETVFLPGTYFLEIWAIEIPDAFARGLCRPGQSQSYFTPGVDVDLQFVNLVNELAGTVSNTSDPLPEGIVNFKRQQETDWDWVPYLRCVQAGNLVAKHLTQQYHNDITEVVFSIPTDTWHDRTVLIVPRMGMSQDTDKLYLDTGHWGPGENPIILVNPKTDLVIKHNVRTGIITYSQGK